MSNKREKGIQEWIASFGDNPAREGLRDTPRRVIKSWGFLCSGYHQKMEDLFTCFDAEGYDDIVLLKDIEFYSLCEHHLLPFFGKAHVGYLPGDKIIGISKLARVVDAFARRLQTQERICKQVVDVLEEYLAPRGAFCILEAVHLCMRMRGVEKQNSLMVCSSISGIFRDDFKIREELYSLLGRKF